MAVGKNLMVKTIPLLMNFGMAAAITDPQVCYILDGILFLYGIILSALYCRLKILNTKKAKAKNLEPVRVRNKFMNIGGLFFNKRVDDIIYMGLAPHDKSTYETIGLKK